MRIKYKHKQWLIGGVIFAFALGFLQLTFLDEVVGWFRTMRTGMNGGNS